tara:strand:- start:1476 stop:2120 length:645 start_codon:yes stop_codon:yes gene_type:complete
MKIKLLTSFLVIASVAPVMAQVDMELEPMEEPMQPEFTTRGTYVGVTGMWVDNNTDGAVGGGLRLGWNFEGIAPYFISTDVELEATYWDVDSEVKYGNVSGTARTKNLPMMVNLRVNIPLSNTGLLIYGGGGAGISYIDIKGTSALGQSVDDSGAVFTYSFFVGIGAYISERASIRAGYRSLWLGDDSFNDGSIKVSMSTERNDIFELAIRIGL